MGDEAQNLQGWLEELSQSLDTGGYVMDEESIHIILDLARDAARNVVRPSAPLTAFLVGVAVGRGQSLGSAAAKATELALTNDEDA